MRRKDFFSYGCMLVFVLPFCGVGLFTLATAAGEFARGNWRHGFALAGFGLVFAGVGFGMLAAAIIGMRRAKRAGVLKAQNPNEPWLWREDWARGEVESSDQLTLVGAWIFALVWNGISWPLVFPLVLGESKRQPLVFFALAFPLVGLGLLTWAIRATLRWKKYRKSIFKMAAVPGVIGGQLGGLIETSTKLRARDGFRLRLACIRSVTTGSGEDRSTREDLLWEDEKIIVKELLEDSPTRSAIPVFFQIPFECRETDEKDSDNKVLWRLEARADAPGTDYSARWEVPVFKTAESREKPEPVADPTAQFQAPPQPYVLPAGSRIKVSPRGDGVEFVFPAARNLAMCLFLTGFTIVWSGVIFFMVKMKTPLLFPIVFGLFDAVILFALLDMWLRSSRVTIDSSGVTAITSWLFFRRVSQLDAASIAEIKAQVSGTQQGSSAYYDLKVVLGAGKEVTVANVLRDKRQAQWLAQQMKAALGKT